VPQELLQLTSNFSGWYLLGFYVGKIMAQKNKPTLVLQSKSQYTVNGASNFNVKNGKENSRVA
jgi:hypothetical protein